MAPAVSARGTQVIVWSYVTFSIAALFVLLRLVVRWKIVHVIGKEDACIALASISALLCCVFMSLEVAKGGLGQHFASLSEVQLSQFQKFSYFSILFYNLSLCLTKFGILFLCLRVFAPSNWLKACHVALILISIYTFWVIITSIVPCVPVRSYWDSNVHGWCYPKSVLWFVNAGLNICSDFLIVLLPIPGILALQLPKKQKIGVSLVFVLGLFVCIISVIRLHALRIAVTTPDPTYDNFGIAIWTVVEVNGAIVGACLPTLKPLCSRFWPKLLSSGRSHPTHPTGRYFHHSMHNTAREPQAQHIVDLPDMLADDVVLTTIDHKGAVVRTERAEDDDQSQTQASTLAERPPSAGSWTGSGRSDERPVYQSTDGAKVC